MHKDRQHPSTKYKVTQKTETTKYRYQLKKEPPQPTFSLRNIKTESMVNSTQRNNRTNSAQKYSSRNNRESNALMNNKRGNKDNEKVKKNANKKNYEVISRKKESNISNKVSNSNYEGYNKWRGGRPGQLSNYTQNPNERGQMKLKYQTRTIENQPTQLHGKYISYKTNLTSYTKVNDDSKDNSRNIYISGSSQSNTVSSRRHNTTEHIKNQKINIISSKTNLINKNKNKFASPEIRTKVTSGYKSSSFPVNNNNYRNNTVSHTIINIKNTSQKPVVLNVRKTDVIRYHVGMPQRYSVELNNCKPLISNANHSIKITRNVTKELKTIADVPDSGRPKHRYNYKRDPNLSNIISHSIDDTKKNQKKKS